MPFHTWKISVCRNSYLYTVEGSCKRNWITNLGLHIRYWCQWPRGLRLRSAAARLLRLWFRIPPGAGSAVSVVCCQGEVSATAQSCPEVNSASCTMGTDSFLRVKRPQRIADHPSLPSARLHMVWKRTSVSPLCACIGMSWGDLHLKRERWSPQCSWLTSVVMLRVESYRQK